MSKTDAQPGFQYPAYQIIRDVDLDGLEDKVNELVKKKLGYVPVGGVTVTGHFYLQAVTRLGGSENGQTEVG